MHAWAPCRAVSSLGQDARKVDTTPSIVLGVTYHVPQGPGNGDMRNSQLSSRQDTSGLQRDYRGVRNFSAIRRHFHCLTDRCKPWTNSRPVLHAIYHSFAHMRDLSPTNMSTHHSLHALWMFALPLLTDPLRDFLTVTHPIRTRLRWIYSPISHACCYCIRMGSNTCGF